MRCSYCGSEDATPQKCSNCGATFSNQELESEAERLKALIERFDGKNEKDKELVKKQASNLCFLLEELLNRGNTNVCLDLCEGCLILAKLAVNNNDAESGNFWLKKYKDSLKKGAEAGDRRCQHLYAESLENPRERDFWMKKAAENGSVEAQDYIEAENNPDVSETRENPGSAKTIFTIIGLIVFAILILLKFSRIFI